MRVNDSGRPKAAIPPAAITAALTNLSSTNSRAAVAGSRASRNARVSFHQRILQTTDQFFSVAWIRIGLEVDTPFAPGSVADRAGLQVRGVVGLRRGEHLFEHSDGMWGVSVDVILGQQRSGLDAVFAGPELRFDHGIDHLLRPFGALLQVTLVHEDDAAGVILPNIAGEAQNFADAECFRRGVERFRNDVTGDLAGGEGRHHVGRRHHDQIDFVRCRIAGPFGHRGQAVLAQQDLQHDIMDRIPERNSDGLAAQFLDAVDLRTDAEAGAAGMIPGDDFRGRLAAEAGPHSHRRKQMDDIDLPRDEGFQHLRPAPQHHRLFSFETLGFKVSFAMSHQQRRGIRNREVADPHRRIGFLRAGLIAAQQRESAGRGKQCSEFHHLAAGNGINGHGISALDQLRRAAFRNVVSISTRIVPSSAT